MSAYLVALLASATQATASETLRLIPSLVITDRGQVELRVENAGHAPLDTSLLAELVLAPPERAPRLDTPVARVSYHSRLDLRETEVRPSAGSTRVQVVANGSRTWVLSLGQVKWYEKVGAARSTARPFRQVVPPGQYQLTLWFEKGDSPWWASQALQVSIDKPGQPLLTATEHE